MATTLTLSSSAHNVILNTPIYDVECKYYANGNCWYQHQCRYKHIQTAASLTISQLLSAQQTMKLQIENIVSKLKLLSTSTTTSPPQNRSATTPQNTILTTQNRIDTTTNMTHPITVPITQNRSMKGDDDDDKKCEKEVEEIISSMAEEPPNSQITPPHKPPKIISHLTEPVTQKQSITPVAAFLKEAGKECGIKSIDKIIFNNTGDNPSKFFSWIITQITGGTLYGNDQFYKIMDKVVEEMENESIYTGYYAVQTIYDILDGFDIKYRKLWPERIDE